MQINDNDGDGDEVQNTGQQLQYMDSHTHLLDYTQMQQPHQVIKNALSNGVKKIVVNTTTSKQFQRMYQLRNKYPDLIVASVGVHPYYVGQQSMIDAQIKTQISNHNTQKIQNDYKKQEMIEKINQQQHNNKQPKQTEQIPDSVQKIQQILFKNQNWTVGEIGLDFRKSVLQSNAKQLQTQYFLSQLNVALRLNRPATIHCVHAYGEMLKIFKNLNKKIDLYQDKVKPNLIMHSYGGSIDITKSLIKLTNLNIYFSLCLRRSVELCQVIPIQRLICQTDSPCQNNIDLIKQQNRLQFNKYYMKVKKNKYQYNKNEQKLADQKETEKTETNQPVNVIANVKSLSSQYGIEQSKFIKTIWHNSLRAFKLLK